MSANDAVDDYEVPWTSFLEFFLDRTDDAAPFLIELNHEAGSRQEWSVAEWRNVVLSAGDWLSRRGVRPGDAVATLLGNSADALCVAYGAWVLGACCVPLNPADSRDRHEFILRDSGTRVLVCGEGAAQGVAEVARQLGIGVAYRDDLPTRRAAETHRAPDSTSSTSVDDAALRVYTSGTTGLPKGVALSVRNLLTDCDALRLGLNWPTDTRILTVLPVHHVNGLVISSLLPWFASLSTVLCDRFRSDFFWEDVAAERATVCSMVPSLLEFLLSDGGRPALPLREVLSGAGPLLTETAVEFERRFEVPIRHLYGLSETTAVVTLMPSLTSEDRHRWHSAYGYPSIGAALPHAEVRIHDPEDEPLGPQTRGQIVVRGAMVMDGYAGNPEDTETVLANGWFHTGDEGFWVPGGNGVPHFFITGRIKELIIRGGANVSPLEVDAVLRSHPAVDFGLAVPFENRFYGEEIAAYVVTNRPVSDEELLAHCARYLDFSRQPKIVIQGEDVPFTSTGKAKRLELRARLAPHLEQYRDHQFRRSESRRTNAASESAAPHGGENQ